MNKVLSIILSVFTITITTATVTHAQYNDAGANASASTNVDTSVPEYNICSTATDQAACDTCKGEDGVWTAIGCLHTNPDKFVADFLKIAVGIAGGIALLLMVYGAFLVSTSAGDPKKADEGKEIITGTIAGLLFIIFSVVLLKLIGVDILQIPGLK